MRTTVKYQMDDPTRIKWDKYISLIPETDNILRTAGVDLLSRHTEERDYSVEVVDEYDEEDSDDDAYHPWVNDDMGFHN